MGTAESVIVQVNTILTEQFEVDPALIHPDALLREDLDLDSLDGADLLIAIEKRFRIRLDDQLVRTMRTVGEVHSYVQATVNASEPGVEA